jgi:hypothetical protein
MIGENRMAETIMNKNTSSGVQVERARNRQGSAMPEAMEPSKM